MIVLIISVIICGAGFYFGSRAINKVPNENLRGRLLKASEYIALMIFCSFIALMEYQSLHFLSTPSELQSSAVRDSEHYQSIQSLQMAHTSFYFTALFTIMTSHFLIRKALK